MPESATPLSSPCNSVYYRVCNPNASCEPRPGDPTKEQICKEKVPEKLYTPVDAKSASVSLQKTLSGVCK